MADDRKREEGKRRFAHPILYGLIAILLVAVLAIALWPKDRGDPAPVARQLPAETGIAAPVETDNSRPFERGTLVEWSAENYPDPVTFRGGDIIIHVSAERQGEDYAPLLRIEAPGMREHLMKGGMASPSTTHRIGVGRLNQQARMDHVLLASYSGGAHCCTAMKVAAPVGDGFETVDLGEWDGAGVDAFPTDITGDGTADFVLYDNAFLYTFASYAESYAPPAFYNLVGTRFVNVSKSPAFRGRFTNYMREAHAACVNRDGATVNGACAGYVAAAARVGFFRDAWAEMLNAYDADFDWALPPGCQVSTDVPCPESQQIQYDSYPEALYHFLIDTGYIAPGTPRPAAPASEPGEYEDE